MGKRCIGGGIIKEKRVTWPLDKKIAQQLQGSLSLRVSPTEDGVLALLSAPRKESRLKNQQIFFMHGMSCHTCKCNTVSCFFLSLECSKPPRTAAFSSRHPSVMGVTKNDRMTPSGTAWWHKRRMRRRIRRHEMLQISFLSWSLSVGSP